jgi:hypothetical protein
LWTGNALSKEAYVVSRESVNGAHCRLCMTWRAGRRRIDLEFPHVICAAPVSKLVAKLITKLVPTPFPMTAPMTSPMTAALLLRRDWPIG